MPLVLAIGNIFRGFKVADKYVTKHATRDLLCHRTGLNRGDLLFVKGDLSRKDTLSRLRFLQQAGPFMPSWGRCW